MNLSGSKKFPSLRTLDADFLIPKRGDIRREVDVPSILKSLGFVPTFYRASEWVVYDHPELRVEFLIPELGRGSEKAQEVKSLGVKAQALRYLNLLASHPRVIDYKGLSIRVPEPAAFALQKLIISQRRSKREKREKDLDTATEILDYIFNSSNELIKLKSILKSLPDKWCKTILSISKNHHPKLSELLVSHK